jgi:GTP pyrophosphokinase
LRVSHAQAMARTRGSQPDTQLMHFTVELPSSDALRDALRSVTQLPGVRLARRR